MTFDGELHRYSLGRDTVMYSRGEIRVVVRSLLPLIYSYWNPDGIS